MAINPSVPSKSFAILGGCGFAGYSLSSPYTPLHLFSSGRTMSGSSHHKRNGNIRQLELGGQAIDMRTGGCFQFPRCDTPQFGVGAGMALNLNSHFALDSGLNVLPRSTVSDGYFENGSVVGGRASEFLAGVRAEARARNYGFFLDAAPGIVSWSQITTGQESIREPNGVIGTNYTHARRTFFASKVGAGFEFSPRTRVHVRVDFADLIIRYGHGAIWTCDTCVTWRNNPQITVGLYAGLESQSHGSRPNTVRKSSTLFGAPPTWA
jgi:hypothetical protein